MLCWQHRSLHISVIILLVLLLLVLFTTLTEHDSRLGLVGLSSFHLTDCPRPKTGDDLVLDGLAGEIVPSTTGLRRKNIAVASSFGAHFDVYMTVAWTIARVFQRSSTPGHVQVYADAPFGFGFQKVVEDLGLYRGTYRDPRDLVPDILSGRENTQFDLIVFGTCEIDLKEPANGELLAAWDALSEDRKFKLVCVVHNVQDTGWQPAIREWARRDAIRLLPISQHVGDSFRRAFDILADSNDIDVQSAGYEYIPIDVHVPILDVPDLPTRSTRILSHAVIQGSFTLGRRNYLQIFTDLIHSLADDPHIWGYKPREEGQVAYQVDEEQESSAFHLYLLGSGSLEIPAELQDVISIHTGLEYPDFFSLMGTMDICLPAFADFGYYDAQASSTFAMALECDVPILVTERMKHSYTYAHDERIVITRPAAVGEIAAIRALRSGSFQADGTQYHPSVTEAVYWMLRRGWIKNTKSFSDFKNHIWQANEDVIRRVLQDL